MRFAIVRWMAGFAAAAAIWAAANLYLQPGIEAELAGRARQALLAEPGAERWARVTARGREVEIEGEAPSSEAKRAALSAVKRVAGVRLIRDGATVAPQPNVFAWSATRSRGRVLLAGAVPAAAQPALHEEARRVFPDADIADRTRPADGAPDSFTAAAALALSALAHVPEGEVALEGTRLRIRGSAPDVAAFAAVRALRTALPQGFTLDLAALAPAAARPFTLALTRKEDGIALTGYAPSETAAAALVGAARKAFPGALVTESLRIAAGFPTGADFAAVGRFALTALSDVKSGSVTLTDAVVDVHGTAPDRQGAVDVASRARGELPAGLRAGKVTVTAAPVSPFRLTARRTAEGLELSGHYPDAQARAAVAEAVNQLYFEGVEDRLRLGDGAPRGFGAAAAFALEQLSQLAAGEAEVEGGTIRISGETPYVQLADMLRARIPGSAPAGWTATAEIRPDPPATASIR